MDNFLILIREDIAQVSNLSEVEMQADIEAYTQWVENLAAHDHFVSGEPLEAKGKYMTKEQVSSDGPFIESKEVVTGFILIKARDLDEAVELSKTCPIFKGNGGALEVRPIMKY
ncbi:YciI family protein [Fulvivirga sediminis]|uniref:Transcription initiation protein n=1 Tax=Fulvivirga sediminis TaxID=2803949 RepID=A0A937F763_9BACT|nr:YciI family protein [Fulvivirga sediminis]MBL3655233.1 transcription initiation protein [Fulvivirga sediminis]